MSKAAAREANVSRGLLARSVRVANQLAAAARFGNPRCRRRRGRSGLLRIDIMGRLRLLLWRRRDMAELSPYAATVKWNLDPIPNSRDLEQMHGDERLALRFAGKS
jgi:hypothetical protein